jgi:hypothetical protein
MVGRRQDSSVSIATGLRAVRPRDLGLILCNGKDVSLP